MTAPDPKPLDDALAAERAAEASFATSEYARGEADQKAADQPILDAANQALTAANATIAQDKQDEAALNAEIVDLQAQLAALQPVKTVETKDFAAGNFMIVTGSKSLVGPSTPDKLIYRMTPKSSTKTPPTTKGQTNPYHLISVGGSNSGQLYAGIEIGNFTLEGTDQGHLYGGLRLQYSKSLNVHDVIITGVPGNDSGPPGETFGVAMWHPADATLTNVKVDGRRTSDGAKVGATLFGYNFNTGTTTANNLVANYAIYGFAVAMWQCTGHQIFNNCDFRFCRKAINIEQAFGGTYDFNACDFRGITSVPYVAQISARQSSAVVNFHDPVVDSYPMQVRTFPSAVDNVQKDSDIHMFIGGKDVTSDPTKFKITHTG